MNDVMIDIETLATSPRAVVLSIGALAFDAESPAPDGTHGLPMFYTALQFEDQKGRDIDPATVRWWMNQKADAQHAAFTTEASTDFHEGYMGTVDALAGLADFVRFNAGSAGKVWAKSPSFDCNILGTLYADHDMVEPWKYAQERDVRTIVDVGDVTNPVGCHEPIGDCAEQIEAVWAAYTRLRGEQVRVVLEASDGPHGGRFVEVENVEGKSINAGTWHDRDDGFQELRISGVRR
jgi:hypothetical protein